MTSTLHHIQGSEADLSTWTKLGVRSVIWSAPRRSKSLPVFIAGIVTAFAVMVAVSAFAAIAGAVG